MTNGNIFIVLFSLLQYRTQFNLSLRNFRLNAKHLNIRAPLITSMYKTRFFMERSFISYLNYPLILSSSLSSEFQKSIFKKVKSDEDIEIYENQNYQELEDFEVSENKNTHIFKECIFEDSPIFFSVIENISFFSVHLYLSINIYQYYVHMKKEKQ